MNVHPEPRRGGPVGLGCGLLLGLAVGAAWVGLDGFPPWTFLIPAAALAAAAYFYGDRFWEWLMEHGWKLPWF